MNILILIFNSYNKELHNNNLMQTHILPKVPVRAKIFFTANMTAIK